MSGLQGASSGLAARSADSAAYSRAFEAFVNSEQDVVGLLAYALYKQNVREAVVKGLPTQPRTHRTPTNVERDAYRGAAERLLQRISEASITAATPEILQRGFDGAVESAKDELIDVIKERTTTKSAVISNLIAWVITLALTVLLIVGIYLPNWQNDLVERLRQTQPAPAQLNPPASQR